jgi:hypothetical protein
VTKLNDSLVQVWLERRYIATAVNLLHAQGVIPRSVAEVVREVFNLAVDAAAEQGQVEFVSSTEDAIDIMAQFRSNLNPKGRGLNNLRKNLNIQVGRLKHFSLTPGPESFELDETILREMKKQAGVDETLLQITTKDDEKGEES